jgi:5-methylcytosine-specific restriction endonuclease McrA
MRKASPFCEICGATSPLVADHIIPIAEDPSMAYEPLNLRVLCVRDNAARKDRCTPEERDAVHAAIAARKARAARAHASRENHTNS